MKDEYYVKQQAKQIQEYWASRGVKCNVWVEKISDMKGKNKLRYSQIRSDIVMRVPK